MDFLKEALSEKNDYVILTEVQLGKRWGTDSLRIIRLISFQYYLPTIVFISYIK